MSYTRFLEYTTVGCPVDCGVDWIEKYIIVAIKHGPCSSTMKEVVSHALHKKVLIHQEYARIVTFEKFKKNMSNNLTGGYDTAQQ